jgi:hypothetical protein
VPFAALAWVSGERLLAALAAAAIVLTQFEFPARYADLVLSDTTAIVLVAIRNALLLAALSVALVRLAGPARSHPRASAVPP